MKGDAPLTMSQKNELCLVVQMGSSRATACDYVGISGDQLESELAADGCFERQLRRAEATAEMQHMHTVQQAAKDQKNWRSCTWWLEQRAELRQQRDRENATQADVPGGEWAELVDGICELILTDIADPELRRKIERRLADYAAVDSADAAGADDEQ